MRMFYFSFTRLDKMSLIVFPPGAAVDNEHAMGQSAGGERRVPQA